MDEHKENIHDEDINVKMQNAGEDEKVSMSGRLAGTFLKEFTDTRKLPHCRYLKILVCSCLKYISTSSCISIVT